MDVQPQEALSRNVIQRRGFAPADLATKVKSVKNVAMVITVIQNVEGAVAIPQELLKTLVIPLASVSAILMGSARVR